MEIVIDRLLAGARRARGTVVIIDVLRAFTTAAVAFSRGCRQIVMVALPEQAQALRQRGGGDLLLGEVDGIRPAGFDFGNSPFELSQAAVSGKSLIQSTRAGTCGVAAVVPDCPLYAASLVTAAATARRLAQVSPALITLVAMGRNGQVPTDEDELCAGYIRDSLLQQAVDRDALRRKLYRSGEVAKYRDAAQPQFDPRDVDIAFDIDRFDFCIRVDRRDGLSVAYRQ